MEYFKEKRDLFINQIYIYWRIKEAITQELVMMFDVLSLGNTYKSVVG